MRLRCLSALLGALVSLVLTTGPARAQSRPIDVDRFQPAPGTARLLVVDTAEIPERFQLSAQLFVHYADAPLQLAVGGKTSSSLVRDRITTDAAIAIAFLGRYQLSVALPATVYQRGSDPTGLGLAPNESRGVEDLRVQGKARIFSNDWFGVGGALELVFPTGSQSAYLGSGNVTGTARVFAHLRAAWFRLALMAGWRFAFVEEELLGARSGNSLIAGVGLGAEVWKSAWYRTAVELTAEAWGQFHYSFDGPVNMPAEALLAVHVRLVDMWTFYLGMGAGLDRGFGEPNVRVVGGVSWAWEAGERSSPVHEDTRIIAPLESEWRRPPAAAGGAAPLPVVPAPPLAIRPTPSAPSPATVAVVTPAPSRASGTPPPPKRKKAAPPRRTQRMPPAAAAQTGPAVEPPLPPSDEGDLLALAEAAKTTGILLKRYKSALLIRSPEINALGDHLARVIHMGDCGAADEVFGDVGAGDRGDLALRIAASTSDADAKRCAGGNDAARRLVNTLVYELRASGHKDESERLAKHLRVTLPEIPVAWRDRDDLYDALGPNFVQLAEVEKRQKEGLTVMPLQRADGRWVDYVFFVHNREVQRWAPLSEIGFGAFSAKRDPPPETWLLDWQGREVQRARLYGETQADIERLIDAKELHLPKQLAADYALAARELNNDVQFFMLRGDCGPQHHCDLFTSLRLTQQVHEEELVTMLVQLANAIATAAGTYDPHATSAMDRAGIARGGRRRGGQSTEVESVERGESTGGGQKKEQRNGDGQAVRKAMVEALHRRSLGMDPARGGQFREHEARVGSELEQRLGKRLERFRTGDVDWIDANGRTYDLLGPVPAEHFNSAQFNARIDHHIGKTDVPVVDLRGLRPEQVAQVDAHLAALPPAARAKILIFR